MARYRFQEKGCLFLRGTRERRWVLRFREDVIRAGEDKPYRVLKSVVLGLKRDIPTKKLAQRKANELLARINSISYRPGRIATVSDFAEIYKSQALSQRKDSTIHASESHLKNQIIPQLGQFRLDQLANEVQQRFINKIAEKLKPKTVDNVVGTLSAMLTKAKDWKYTTETVDKSTLVFPERGVKEQAPSFTLDQAREIIARAKGQFRVMFAIALLLGLRVGEILGLRAEDFDFENKTVRIRRSVWRGKVQTPKNENSEATLPVPDILSVMLKEFLGDRQGFLFLNQRGHFFIAENVNRQALWPILDDLKIPRCGFHAFRHAHSSLLLSDKVRSTPKVTQKQMRHADPRITLELYTHVIDDEHRETVEKLSSVLFPVVPNSEVQTQ